MSFDLSTMLDQLAQSAWLPVVLFVLCVLDGIVPVVPSETTLIAAGAFAAMGHPSLALIASPSRRAWCSRAAADPAPGRGTRDAGRGTAPCSRFAAAVG